MMVKCSTCGNEYPDDSFCKNCAENTEKQIDDINEIENMKKIFKVVKENWPFFLLVVMFIALYFYHVSQIDACNAFWKAQIPKNLNTLLP